MGTRLYTVHYREEARGSLTGLGKDAILVKVGFSWPAFLVPLLWLAYKRMWIVLALFLAVEAGLAALSFAALASDDVIFILSLAVNVILGLEGNDLYRWSLSRRRYRERAVVAGEDLEAAERQFFAAAATATAP